MDNPTGWASLPSHISPVLFQIGSFQLRWYSLMYLVAFGLTYFLVVRRIRQEKFPYTPETIQDLFIWIILGLILGGRLGYVLFYNLDYYSHHLLEIFLPFEFTGGVRFVGISGMSFHGGLVGVLLAAIWFCRRNGIAFWNMVDLICPAVPLGYTFGRLGNFLNGELWGRATTMPWGMYFPLDPTGQLRHPSQLYEALFEGIVLFAILWAIRRKSPFDGFLFSLYLIGYGLIRFVIEFFREPDAQLGLLLFSLSMGQILCLLMIGAGLAVFWMRKTAAKRNR